MHFMKQLNHYGLIAATLVFAPGTYSQTQKDTLSNDTLVTLPSMTVSVTRIDIAPEKLPQKIEIVDSLDLKLTVADDITDVLKKNASIDVIQYPGVLAGVGIRGFRPSTGSGLNQRTLTLFDGRPSGSSNLATMQVYNIDHIEVVKGPVSALYGPQAMGGVINIIPKRSIGPVKSEVKGSLSSFETMEAVAHSGGSLFKYLNYDLTAAIFNRGKDYRIGSNYSLDKFSDSRYPGYAKDLYKRDSVVNGDTIVLTDTGVVRETNGKGMIRHYTKYDKQNFALRLGTDLFDDRISIDLRGEMFGADGVETPGDISSFDDGAGFKNVRRNDEQISVSGDFDVNKFKAAQYWNQEFSERFKDFSYNDTMYKYYSSGTEWFSFQLKDDIYLPLKDYIIKPILTIGFDYSRAEAWSEQWKDALTPKAPSSPDSRQSDAGVYGQVFADYNNGRATATLGLRYDNISVKMLKTDLLPNVRERSESFNVVSPSYGLTFSPVMTNSYLLSLYHNLGKGFMPQSASNLAIYNVSAPTRDSVDLTVGNPDLDPEENITVDGGIRFNMFRYSLDASLGAYYTVVDNFVLNSSSAVAQGMKAEYNGKSYSVRKIATYRNSPYETRMAGLEWNLEWNILSLFKCSEKLSLSTNGQATLLSETVNMSIYGRDTVLDTMEVNNVRNPNFSVGLTFDDNKRICARLSTRYLGKQKDTDWSASTYKYRGVNVQPYIIYPEFLITDFSLRVRITDRHTVSAQISNITDENYYEKRGYNLPGRTFGLGYEVSF